MLELTGVASVLRGVALIYWLVAIGTLAVVLLRVKPVSKKAIWACVVVAVFGFLPAKGFWEKKQRETFAREAWAHFRKLCDERSGERIYKTFTGVKSVLVVKPLPPATEKDLFDQYWYGDPYSSATATRTRGESAAGTLLTIKYTNGQNDLGLEFVEIQYGNGNLRYVELTLTEKPPFRQLREVKRPLSRFALSWEDISTPKDRSHWVAGSKLRLIDRSDGSVIAERVGYLIESGFGSQAGARRPWLTSRGPKTTCPSIKNGDFEDRWFIFRALNPVKGNGHGE